MSNLPSHLRRLKKEAIERGACAECEELLKHGSMAHTYCAGAKVLQLNAVIDMALERLDSRTGPFPEHLAAEIRASLTRADTGRDG